MKLSRLEQGQLDLLEEWNQVMDAYWTDENRRDPKRHAHHLRNISRCQRKTTVLVDWIKSRT